MWLIVLFITVFCIVYFLMLKPMYQMLKLKLQFGKDCLIQYHFFGGEVWVAQDSMKNTNNIMQRQCDLYLKHKYKIFVSNFLWNIRISIADPEYHKHMLQNHDNYTKINKLHNNDLLSNALFFQQNDVWKSRRKLFGQQFEFSYLRDRIPLIRQICEEKLQNINLSQDIFETFQEITGLVVIRSFLGNEFEKFKINNQSLQLEITNIINEVGAIRYTSKFMFLKRFIFNDLAWYIFPTQKEKELLSRIKELRFVLNNKIQEIKQKEEENQQTDNFVSLLLKSKNQQGISISTEEIVQQFISILFAGTDTTATLCYHCLYYFAVYKQFQNEIRSEIIQNNQTSKDINNCIKLNSFILETLRLKNPTPKVLLRTCNKTHYVNNLKLEKGWTVAIDYYFSSFSDKHFDKPEIFDYTRWQEKQPIKNDNSFIFIPFSAGPRNCIGQHMALIEAKILLSNILLNYEIILNEDVQPIWKFNFIYQLTPGNCVILKKIQKNENID